MSAINTQVALDDLRHYLSEWIEEISFFLECNISPDVIAEASEALDTSILDFHKIVTKKHKLPPSLFNAILSYIYIKEIYDRIDGGDLQDTKAEALYTMIDLVHAGMMVGSAFKEKGEEIQTNARPLFMKGWKFTQGPKRPRDRRTPLDKVLESAFKDIFETQHKNEKHPSFDEFLDSLPQHEDVIQEIDKDEGKVFWGEMTDKKNIEHNTAFGTIRNKLTKLKRKHPIKK